MDQSVNEPQPLNIDQVPGNLYSIKREDTDDEGDQLPNVPPDNGDKGPSCGESPDDDEEEEDDSASHVNSHQHAEESDGRMSSVSIERAQVSSQDTAGVNGQINSIASQLIKREDTEETVSIQLPVNLSVHNCQALPSHSPNASENDPYSSDLNDNRYNRDGEEQQMPQRGIVTSDDNPPNSPLSNAPQNNGDQRPESIQLPVNLSVPNSHHQALPSHSQIANENESHSSDHNDNRHDRDGEEQQQMQPRADAPANDNRPNCSLPNAPQCPSVSRVLVPLAPSSTPSLLAPVSQAAASLVNQLPANARANLPTSRPSNPKVDQGNPQPHHDTVALHGGVSGQLVGRCLTNSNFKIGDIVREHCEFVGTFTINYTGGYNGTFKGIEVEWGKRKISGTIYEGKFNGIFDGDVQRENVFCGQFRGTLTGRFVGTLDSVSNVPAASSNAVISIKDEEDDKDRVKSKIEVINLDDVEDVDDDEVQFIEPPLNGYSNEQPNHGELDGTSNRDAHHQIRDESDDRDVNFDNDHVDATANHDADNQIRNDNVVEDDDFDDDDVDDTQSDVSADSSVASEDETTNNNPDSQDQQQQPQRRKSLRIVELENRAALKRAQQQELPVEVENIEAEVKRTKTQKLDKSHSRKTMSVKCSDCQTSFGSFAEMYEHKLTVHKVERYLCFADGCTESFDNTYRLSVHSAAKHPKGTTLFACRNCSDKFGSQTNAKAHFNKCGTKGVFGCTCCSCHAEMISLTTAHDHLDPLKNTSAHCTETAQCGKTFTNKRALIIHKSERHRLYKHSTVHRCKLCNILCTFNSKTIIKHFRSVHGVKGQLMKYFEQNTETMTKEQVELLMKKLGKQGKSKSPLVAPFDPFVPSTSGTQRRPMDSFDNRYDLLEYDDDEGAYHRTIPSTSQQQPSHGQGNQFRHPKCLVRDLTKE